MSSESATKRKLHRALRRHVQPPLDSKGYTTTPAENLVEGVTLDLFEDDLRKGSGGELRMKFCAAHSSAALAVNTFAWFKHTARSPSLSLFGSTGANCLTLEKPFPIFRKGTPPNLDVWIERNHENVAIESKLTEYFTKKRPSFSTKYDELERLPLAESGWWRVYQQAKKAAPQHLDIAQLVKHYFGLWKFQQETATKKPIRFLYLFWEPRNGDAIQICKDHRKELEVLQHLADCGLDSDITFSSMTYSELWQDWSANPALAQHAANLKQRYDILSA